MRSFTLAAALLLVGLSTALPEPRPDPVPRIEDEEFDGPGDPKRFKFYHSLTVGGGICDADMGPDFIKYWYQDLIAAKMGYINALTGEIKEKTIPYSKGQEGTPPFVGNVSALQCVVRTGKDGYVYGGAGTRNELVQVNPDTFEMRIFTSPNVNPLGNLQNFNDAWATDEGIFFSSTTADTISIMEYGTYKFHTYKCPTPLSGPLGMRTDKHDNLWFTNFFLQFISKFDNSTRKITEYKKCCPLPFGAFPEVLRSETENQRYLWANAFGGGGYIRIDVLNPDKPRFKIFTNPRGQGTFPFENDNDYCGRIWYTSPTVNVLNYYDPPNDKWTTIDVPGALPPKVGAFEVSMHRGPGPYMWFVQGANGRIGRYTLDKSCVKGVLFPKGFPQNP